MDWIGIAAFVNAILGPLLAYARWSYVQRKNAEKDTEEAVRKSAEAGRDELRELLNSREAATKNLFAQLNSIIDKQQADLATVAITYNELTTKYIDVSTRLSAAEAKLVIAEIQKNELLSRITDLAGHVKALEKGSR